LNAKYNSHLNIHSSAPFAALCLLQQSYYRPKVCPLIDVLSVKTYNFVYLAKQLSSIS